MKTCCGEPRDTPFCPTCGTQLVEGTAGRLASLRAHVWVHVESASKRLDEVKRQLALKDRDKCYASEGTRRLAENRLAKWSGWLAAIDELTKAATPIATQRSL